MRFALKINLTISLLDKDLSSHFNTLILKIFLYKDPVF